MFDYITDLSPSSITVLNAEGHATSIPIRLTQSAEAIEIDTGKIQARIPLSGASLIDTFTTDGRVVARDGRLLCTLDTDAEFTSEIKKVTVEQTGPVRAVVKLEGVHRNATREWQTENRCVPRRFRQCR